MTHLRVLWDEWGPKVCVALHSVHIALPSPHYLVTHNSEGIGHDDVECAKDDVYAVTASWHFDVFGVSVRGSQAIHVFFYLRLGIDSE